MDYDYIQIAILVLIVLQAFSRYKLKAKVKFLEDKNERLKKNVSLHEVL